MRERERKKERGRKRQRERERDCVCKSKKGQCVRKIERHGVCICARNSEE